MSRIDDGHPTLVTFSLSSTVKLYEKEVTPPGLDGGGANDTTTMHNTLYRTFSPKKLISVTESTFIAAYDPNVYSSLLSMLNQLQQITIHFPDGSTYLFWGWINSFKPNRIVEGEQPTAEVQIIPSNQNTSLAETAPVYTAPST